MPYIADRVQETTTTTGTGPVTLGGAVAGYQTFASGFVGKMPCLVEYLLVCGSLWEVGRGILDVSGIILYRDSPKSSSSGPGMWITLTGTTNVYCTAGAELLDNANVGMQYAFVRGMAMQ